MRFNGFFHLVLCVLLVGSAHNVHADVRSGERVTIAADEVVDDDLYIFAQTIVVEGTVKGDLIVFGREIVLNGTIEGDLTAAGQNVVLNGKVIDDVRIAGQVLTLKSEADVGDDLIASGFSMECTAGSRVQGEVRFAGFQSEFAGQVENNLHSASANSRLSGQFGGNVDLVVDGEGSPTPPIWNAPVYPTLPGGLTITESADITGNLKYTSTREGNVSPDAKIAGDLDFIKSESTVAQPPTPISRFTSAAKRFASLFVIGLVIVFVCPKWTGCVVDNVQQRPLASIGWGILALIGVAVGAILLLVATIAIAILLGIVSLENLLPAWLAIGALLTTGLVVGFAVFATWISKIIVSVWAGNRIINGNRWDPSWRILTLALGLVAFVALSAIPWVGGIVSLVVTLVGVGSAALWLFGNLGTKKSFPTSAPIKQVA